MDDDARFRRTTTTASARGCFGGISREFDEEDGVGETMVTWRTKSAIVGIAWTNAGSGGVATDGARRRAAGRGLRVDERVTKREEEKEEEGAVRSCAPGTTRGRIRSRWRTTAATGTRGGCRSRGLRRRLDADDRLRHPARVDDASTR